MLNIKGGGKIFTADGYQKLSDDLYRPFYISRCRKRVGLSLPGKKDLLRYHVSFSNDMQTWTGTH